MPELDDLLQDKLEALEKGETIERVMAGLPEGADELKALLLLATDIRALPHPHPAHALELDKLTVAALREKTRPVAKPRILQPERRTFWEELRIWAANLRIHSPQPRILDSFPSIKITPLRIGLVTAFAGVALVALLAFATLFSLQFQRAQAATLVDVTGIARFASGSQPGEWQPVQDGTRVRAGGSLVTGPNSALTLVFAEGSRMTLGPNSYVTLTELGVGWGNSLHLVVTQHAGKTSHSVVPLRGAKSAYEVITPAGVASVHGTHFSVMVGDQGHARFAVDTGKVVVSEQDSELALEAGQAAAAQPGLLPETPDYQFELKGELTSIDGDIWTVNGVSFTTTTETVLQGEPKTGSFVVVEGRVTASGERLADSISIVEDEEEAESTLTGTLQTIQGDTWIVNGVAIHVNEDTELGEGISLGMPVKVKFRVDEGGRWIAVEIESLVEEEPTPAETPGSETSEPSSEITPTEMTTPTPFSNCTGANPQPKAARLAAQYGVPYEEIMGWFCQHFGFGEIDLAYGLSRQYSISVEQIFALRRSGLGWGQIKQMLASGQVTPTPTITPTEVITTTLTPTATVTLTATGTITPSITLTGTVGTPTPLPSKNDRNCPQQDNPTAQRLAAQYGVSVEEIMGWFCRGFGFGEIDQAYSLSLQYGVPVADIFAMRAGGMGWGQIKQQLRAGANPLATPQPGNGNPGNPGNPGGPGNPGHTPPGKVKTPKPKK